VWSWFHGLPCQKFPRLLARFIFLFSFSPGPILPHRGRSPASFSSIDLHFLSFGFGAPARPFCGVLTDQFRERPAASGGLYNRTFLIEKGHYSSPFSHVVFSGSLLFLLRSSGQLIGPKVFHQPLVFRHSKKDAPFSPLFDFGLYLPRSIYWCRQAGDSYPETSPPPPFRYWYFRLAFSCSPFHSSCSRFCRLRNASFQCSTSYSIEIERAPLPLFCEVTFYVHFIFLLVPVLLTALPHLFGWRFFLWR